MIRTWTNEQKQYLLDNYGKLPYTEIAARLGKTVSQVKSQASNMKITISRKWSDEHLDLLRSLYPNTPTQQIADLIGKNLYTTYSMADKLGLKKTEEYLASPAACRLRRGDNVGAKYRFKKGQTPPNKGLRRPGYAPGRMSETQFKKGQNPVNWKPVGSERVNVDGYIEIKTEEPKKWELKQRVVWREHHGEIPHGHNITFIDGDPLNVAIENLECISKVDWMKRHTFHNYPEPVKQQIHILAGFKRRLNRYAEKQDRRPAEPVI